MNLCGWKTESMFRPGDRGCPWRDKTREAVVVSVLRVGIEPTRENLPADFKSAAFAISPPERLGNIPPEGSSKLTVAAPTR
jgi:hypothetical protein